MTASIRSRLRIGMFLLIAALATVAAFSFSSLRSLTGALETLIESSREKRIGIMCGEAVPWRCHRSLVADALDARGIPAVEILSETNARMHRLTPFAHVEGERVTYPPVQAPLI